MKTPTALQPLIDDGVIDEVIRSLKSGKEATVYLVRTGTQTRCAKVYRDMRQRSFQRRAQYQEGRKIRGSRQARAMNKSTRFGRTEQEAAWKNAEVDALYKLQAAGVRVPKPYGYFNDVLVMDPDPDVRRSRLLLLRRLENLISKVANISEIVSEEARSG